MKRLTAWKVGYLPRKCVLIHQTERSLLRSKKCVQFLKSVRAVSLQRSTGNINAQCIVSSQCGAAGEGD